jgi:hypothetical protein
MDTTFSLQGIDFNKLIDATIKWLLGPGVRVVLILIFAWAAIRLGRIIYPPDCSAGASRDP